MSENKYGYKYNGKILNSILCDMGKIHPKFTARKIESEDSVEYEVVSPTGTVMNLSDGQEFSMDGKSLWRVKLDLNKNLRMSMITKHGIANNLVQKEQGVFEIQGRAPNLPNDPRSIHVPQYKDNLVHIGDRVFVGGTNVKSIYHLEMGESGVPVAVNESKTFTILTGENVNVNLWAKGSRGEYSVYGSDGLVGHFTTNMTEKRKAGKNGMPFNMCEPDKEHGNIVINMGGNVESVSLKCKEMEYQLLIYKDIVKKGFLCHFNVKKPGDKNNNKNGVEGILYPAVGNQPIKFVEKASDGEYYNTASFFPKSEKSVTGVLRDINDAMYMANLSRTPKRLMETIKQKEAEMEEIGKDFKLLEIDPLEDQDYSRLQIEIKVAKGQIQEHNDTYTKEQLKDLNNQTWGKSNYYVIWDAQALVRKNEPTNTYNSGYNN